MNIVIAGITCSGKSTLANLIASSFSNVTILREDDYMKDLRDIPHLRNYYLLDLPRAYETEEYLKDSITLIKEGQILYPTYDVRNNKRIAKKEVKVRGDINVFEGLHTIDILEEIPGTLKVFMDIPLQICLQRRIQRDTKEYGLDEDYIRRYFKEIIESIYWSHIYGQKQKADIVIEKESDIKCLLKKL